MKPESPNQDSFSFIYGDGEFVLAGVYDGHGVAGHHVQSAILCFVNTTVCPRECTVEEYSMRQYRINDTENIQVSHFVKDFLPKLFIADLQRTKGNI